jgi:hypothetical protein
MAATQGPSLLFVHAKQDKLYPVGFKDGLGGSNRLLGLMQTIGHERKLLTVPFSSRQTHARFMGSRGNTGRLICLPRLVALATTCL